MSVLRQHISFSFASLRFATQAFRWASWKRSRLGLVFIQLLLRRKVAHTTLVSSILLFTVLSTSLPPTFISTGIEASGLNRRLPNK